jgi:hypothetical protein
VAPTCSAPSLALTARLILTLPELSWHELRWCARKAQPGKRNPEKRHPLIVAGRRLSYISYYTIYA